MNPTRPWGLVEFFVHYVYLGTMLVNGGLFVLLPPSAQLTYAEYRLFFLGLLGAVALTVPVTFFVYRRYISEKALEHIRLTSGEGPTCAAFKVGTVVVTCLGDFSGVAGASFFTYTRDQNGLALFLGGWAVQYALTAFWVSRGKRYLTQLVQQARSSNVSAAAAR